MRQEIWYGDCLELMVNIPDKSVDAIICDLPYGTLPCKWDTIIPFDKLWEQYERIIKDNAAIVLFGSQPFTTALIASNIKLFKYCWYWKKAKPNGFQHAKNKPMKCIEEIIVFSKAPMGHESLLGAKRMKYNPQGIIPSGIKKVEEFTHKGQTMGGNNTNSSRPNQVGKEYMSFTNFPNDVLEFRNVTNFTRVKTGHPTEKPIDLMEYLIKTYTNKNDLILDNCAGSGSTLVAAKNLSRQFIGIEREREYFDICLERLK